jgi:hypothetical protein
MNKDFFSKYLSYDPETGSIKWKVNRKGPARAGQEAGSLHRHGYIQVGIEGKTYLAHRIAITMSGILILDNDQIDHINCDRRDNSLKNLRVATHAQNCQNATKRKDNKSGFKGVGFDKNRRKWRARVGFDGKQKWLGYFSTPEEAHAAYKEESIRLHGNFSKD